jgi:hypothetical protein
MIKFHQHLFDESLPRIIIGLLKRKYNNDIHIEAIHNFLSSDYLMGPLVTSFSNQLFDV